MTQIMRRFQSNVKAVTASKISSLSASKFHCSKLGIGISQSYSVFRNPKLFSLRTAGRFGTSSSNITPKSANVPSLDDSCFVLTKHRYLAHNFENVAFIPPEHTVGFNRQFKEDDVVFLNLKSEGAALETKDSVEVGTITKIMDNKVEVSTRKGTFMEINSNNFLPFAIRALDSNTAWFLKNETAAHSNSPPLKSHKEDSGLQVDTISIGKPLNLSWKNVQSMGLYNNRLYVKQGGALWAVGVLLLLNVLIFITWYLANLRFNKETISSKFKLFISSDERLFLEALDELHITKYMDLLPTVDLMSKHFVCSNENVSEGRYHCILTAAFSHYDPMHFLFNMVPLIFIGPPCVWVLGPLRFIMLYGVGAVSSSAFSLANHGGIFYLIQLKIERMKANVKETLSDTADLIHHQFEKLFPKETATALTEEETISDDNNNKGKKGKKNKKIERFFRQRFFKKFFVFKPPSKARESMRLQLQTKENNNNNNNAGNMDMSMSVFSDSEKEKSKVELPKKLIGSLGASGSIMCIIWTHALMFPKQIVYYGSLLIRGMRYPLPSIVVAALYSVSDFLLWNSNDGVDHAAHIGGAMLGGLYFVRKGRNLRNNSFVKIPPLHKSVRSSKHMIMFKPNI